MDYLHFIFLLIVASSMGKLKFQSLPIFINMYLLDYCYGYSYKSPKLTSPVTSRNMKSYYLTYDPSTYLLAGGCKALRNRVTPPCNRPITYRSVRCCYNYYNKTCYLLIFINIHRMFRLENDTEPVRFGEGIFRLVSSHLDVRIHPIYRYRLEPFQLYSTYYVLIL